MGGQAAVVVAPGQEAGCPPHTEVAEAATHGERRGQRRLARHQIRRQDGRWCCCSIHDSVHTV